ncbi:MAG: SDR family NAD(P)-dependent oxidoreductase [Coprobacillaceae bacterium]
MKQRKTIFITGASTGIGKETALLFQKNDWNVIATMRNVNDGEELSKLENILVLPCDVLNIASIQKAIHKGLAHFKQIDVIVNNAGYYTLGTFESATFDQIKKQIDTNILGVLSLTKEIIPYFRKQRSGKIINISSIAGVSTVPLQTIYHTTK